MISYNVVPLRNGSEVRIFLLYDSQQARQHDSRNKTVWLPCHLLGLCAPGHFCAAIVRGAWNLDNVELREGMC